MKKIHVLTTLAAACLLTACGGDSRMLMSSSPGRGTLLQNPPPRTASFSAEGLSASLGESVAGRRLLALAGKPKCGVEVQYIRYATVGGAGEASDASGALMTHSGGSGCGGARPIVLYAHGTTTAKSYNLASLNDAANAAYGEARLLAALYAAQGFIVVAPNYAGYDSSSLPYHPYLNAEQASGEMMDALRAARQALPGLVQPVQDSGKLFLTGYSQGGHVAMATHRAMQAAGQSVTASAPMSGPYALAAFTDAVFYGNVNLGSTVFTPLLITSYQKAYGNIYDQPGDLYEPAYASAMERLLPTDTPMASLFAQGKLPQTAFFSKTPPAAPAGSAPTLQATLSAITPPTTPPALAPLFALGFGTANLVNNPARLSYLLDAMKNPDGAVPSLTTGAPAANPAHPLRIATKKNDLRNWTPTRPVLLCGGSSDPTVFYNLNTALMQRLWSSPSPTAAAPGLLSVLDVDSAPLSLGLDGSVDVHAALKKGFTQVKIEVANAAIAAGASDGGAAAVTEAYHRALVPPFCNAAARRFFQKVLDAGL